MSQVTSSSSSPPPDPHHSMDNIAISHGCQPIRVVLNRLTQETLEFYAKRNNPVEDEDDDEDDDDDMYEEKEAQIVTIDLEKIDLASINSSAKAGNVKSSRVKLDDKIFCLFNLEEFDDQYEAVQAFYRELRYAPFRCVECDEATVELKGMVDHYIAHHPTIKKAQYWIEEVPAKEKWVHKFINYQIGCHNEEDDMFPNEIVNKFCPVCNHFDFLLRSTQPRARLKVSSIRDMNHINKHLRYNPWECSLCRKAGRRYAISSVNKKAHDHLLSRHNLTKLDDCQTYFKRSAVIPELENFLREYISIIEESDRANAKPVVRRKPLAGKSNRQNGIKGKSTGQLYKKASASYKSIKESRESVRNVKKTNNRKMIEYKEEDIEDYQTYKDESSKFFCIFCSDDNLSDIYVAWGHYGNHLKYTPIICGICSKTFTSDTTFRYHGIEHVEHSDLPFTRNCDEAIETWGHEFLEGIANGLEAKPEFAEYCPVCEKIFSKPIEPPHLSVNTVKAHIYSHLKYHPYECISCSSQGEKKTFVDELDYQAALHLNSAHSITVTPSEIPKYFVKSRGIEALDKLVTDHFVKIHYLIGTPTPAPTPAPTSITELTPPSPIC